MNTPFEGIHENTYSNNTRTHPHPEPYTKHIFAMSIHKHTLTLIINEHPSRPARGGRRERINKKDTKLQEKIIIKNAGPIHATTH
jgi:hypothetical protein